MSLKKLRKLRLLAGFTQTALADKLKISQPTYQRWEAGTLEVPKGKRRPLAKLLGVSVDDLGETPGRSDYRGTDDGIPDYHCYFGNIALHFRGGGAPLFMPISFEERSRVLANLGSEEDFFCCRSMDNRTVLTRIDSILDVFISSELCDEFGPESERYEMQLDVPADAEFWEVVEKSELAEELDGIPARRVKEILGSLQFDEDLFQEAIASGKAEEADRDTVKAEIDRYAPLKVERATMLMWQFSNGAIRKEYVDDDVVLAATLADFQLLSDEGSKIVLIPSEGWHQSICINANALDYIAFPSHRVDRGAFALLHEEVDGTAQS